jgi:integrase
MDRRMKSLAADHDAPPRSAPVPYAVRTVVHTSGERSPILVDRATGLPVLQVNHWKLFDRRPGTHSSLSIAKDLGDAAFLLDWCANNGVPLFSRMQAGRGLSNGELSELRAACWENLRTGGTVGEGRWAQRVGAIRSLLVCLLEHWLEEQDVPPTEWQTLSASIAYQVARHRRKLRTGRVWTSAKKALGEEGIVQLFQLLNEQSPSNPFHKKLRLRNLLIAVFAYVYGMRRSEMLLLTLSDVDYRAQRPTISIRRSPDNVDDPRDDVAAKTRDRVLPMDEATAALVRRYVRGDRKSLALSKRSPFFFLSRDGTPLGTDGVGSMFKALAKAGPQLQFLTAHVLRHDWTESVKARARSLVASGALPDDLSKLVVNYMGGWSAQSEMADYYSQAAIEQQAAQIHRELSMDLGASLLPLLDKA